MRLVRFGLPGREKPGLLLPDGTVRDLSASLADFVPETLSRTSLDKVRSLDAHALPVVPATVRLGSPVARPGNIVGVGLNYRDHAIETGCDVPSEPILFSKHTSSLNGPNDPVRLPRGSVRCDWEVELAVVIGTEARGVRQEWALEHVAGYTICNDISERTFETERGGQFVKGKSADTFCPLGPVLVTPDEIDDPQNLRLWLSVNGEMMQNASTADMLFPVAFLISYISTFMTLRPGDILMTGTPAGVGAGRGLYLKRGDQMQLGIDGIGTMAQEVV